MNIRSKNIKKFYYLLHNGKPIDYTYYFNDEPNTTISTLLYIGKSTETQVPLTIDNNTVNIIGIFTFCENKQVTSVEIPNGIIEIE